MRLLRVVSFVQLLTIVLLLWINEQARLELLRLRVVMLKELDSIQKLAQLCK